MRRTLTITGRVYNTNTENAAQFRVVIWSKSIKFKNHKRLKIQEYFISTRDKDKTAWQKSTYEVLIYKFKPAHTFCYGDKILRR